jgi:hypothetical protein
VSPPAGVWRLGIGAGDAPLGARARINVPGGGGHPGAGVSAVVMNVTVTGPTSVST